MSQSYQNVDSPKPNEVIFSLLDEDYSRGIEIKEWVVKAKLNSVGVCEDLIEYRAEIFNFVEGDDGPVQGVIRADDFRKPEFKIRDKEFVHPLRSYMESYKTKVDINSSSAKAKINSLCEVIEAYKNYINICFDYARFVVSYLSKRFPNVSFNNFIIVQTREDFVGIEGIF